MRPTDWRGYTFDIACPADTKWWEHVASLEGDSGMECEFCGLALVAWCGHWAALVPYVIREWPC